MSATWLLLIHTLCPGDTSEVYSTVGVGTNIIEASWRALVDAIEYKLWKDDEMWARQGQYESAHVKRTPCEAGELGEPEAQQALSA